MGPEGYCGHRDHGGLYQDHHDQHFRAVVAELIAFQSRGTRIWARDSLTQAHCRQRPAPGQAGALVASPQG